MKVSELKPFVRRVDLVVRVLSKNEIREVVSKEDGVSHRVTEALVGDASGTVLLTLWDDAIDRVEVGSTYQISNAYTSLFQRSLRLNLGRNGVLDESAEPAEDVKEENNLSEQEMTLLSVADLKPFVRRVDLVVRVLSKNEIREVVSKEDGVSHRVTEALVGDASGTVLLTLWDDAIDRLEVGKSYRVLNAYTSLFQRSLRLNLGRNGSAEDAEAVEDVNDSNNVSEKEFNAPRPQNRFSDRSRGSRGSRSDGYDE